MTTASPEVLAGVPPVGTRINTRELAHAAAVPGVRLHNRRSGMDIEVRSRNGDAMFFNPTTQHWTSPERASIDGRLEVIAHTTPESPPSVVTTEGMEVETPLPELETLTQFKQRFRTMTAGAAQRAGVWNLHVEEAYRNLGILDDFDPGPGMIVSPHDTELIRRLPMNTVIQVGRDPARFTHFGVLRKYDTYRWRNLLGAKSFDRGHGKLLYVPGVPEPPAWLQEPWTPQTPDLIAEWRQRAWTVGYEAKVASRWCGEYESAMTRAGVRPPDIGNGRGLPTSSATEISALPEGTILRLGESRDVVWYVRDNRSTNPARTLRICGTMPGAWCNGQALVVWTPGGSGNLSVPVGSRDELDVMPLGTVVSDQSYYWEKQVPRRADQPDRCWMLVRPSRTGGAGYTSMDFSPGAMRYTQIGGL